MNHKTYSKIHNIPKGNASDIIQNGCLVLEGGAFRGLYSEGVLDAMLVNDINISCVIGVSAGALSGINYVSGQIGRAARINLTYRHDSRYVGRRALLHSHSILDVGFLTEDRNIYEPLNFERLNNGKQRFIAVATSCLTGETCYFENGKCSDIMTACRASATMPYISPEVLIDGEPYLDGGCSCKIPYKWALDQGFEKIVIVRTREADFRKEEKISPMAHKVYRKYPEFADKLSVSNLDYNIQCDEIEELHRQGRVFRIAPSTKVEVGRIEKDLEKLGSLYMQGYAEGSALVKDIKKYLSEA